MARIWKVPFAELDDKRIRIQHEDVHRVMQAIEKGWAVGGWEQPQYRIELLTLHQAALVEMHLREMKHDTPLEWHIPKVKQEVHNWTESEIWDDRWALVCRWDGQYRGRIAMPLVYKTLIARYQEQGGCQHEEGTNSQGKCKLCLRARWDEDSRKWLN